VEMEESGEETEKEPEGLTRGLRLLARGVRRQMSPAFGRCGGQVVCTAGSKK
jgi:hypothetical protein